METDFILVFGLLASLLSMPAFVSAFAGGRSMKLPVGLLVAGGLMIVYATSLAGVGYRPEEVPQAVLRVIARIFR